MPLVPGGEGPLKRPPPRAISFASQVRALARVVLRVHCHPRSMVPYRHAVQRDGTPFTFSFKVSTLHDCGNGDSMG